MLVKHVITRNYRKSFDLLDTESMVVNTHHLASFKITAKQTTFRPHAPVRISINNSNGDSERLRTGRTCQCLVDLCYQIHPASPLLFRRLENFKLKAHLIRTGKIKSFQSFQTIFAMCNQPLKSHLHMDENKDSIKTLQINGFYDDF